MARGSAQPTRVDGCVSGGWTERVSASLTKYVTFTADALVFDNQWVELWNPTLFVGYHRANEGTLSEQVRGHYRVPVRKVESLRYDLCTASGY